MAFAKSHGCFQSFSWSCTLNCIYSKFYLTLLRLQAQLLLVQDLQSWMKKAARVKVSSSIATVNYLWKHIKASKSSRRKTKFTYHTPIIINPWSRALLPRKISLNQAIRRVPSCGRHLGLICVHQNNNKRAQCMPVDRESLKKVFSATKAINMVKSKT